MSQPENPELDQHFMKDPKLIKKIVSLLGIRKGETVLEIGAGKGSVTKEIARRSVRVLAVEIDPHMEIFLKGIPKTEVKIQNALDFLDTQKPRFDRVVSNTPYSICEALVRRLPHFRFKKGVFAFPKSFAYILVAKPGEEKRSKLSFLAQEFFDVTIVSDIPKDAFSPTPKTTSAVVTLTPKKKMSLATALLLRDRMLVKNGLRELACEGFFGKKSTKREARKAIKALKISNILLGTKVDELEEKEFKQLVTIVKRIKI